MPAPEPSQARAHTTGACADASLQAENQRVREQSVEERILAALSKKSKFAWLQPTQVAEHPDEQSGS